MSFGYFILWNEQKPAIPISVYSKGMQRQYLHKPTHHVVIKQREARAVFAINCDFVAADNLGAGLRIVRYENDDFVQSKAKGVVSNAV